MNCQNRIPCNCDIIKFPLKPYFIANLNILESANSTTIETPEKKICKLCDGTKIIICTNRPKFGKRLCNYCYNHIRSLINQYERW